MDREADAADHVGVTGSFEKYGRESEREQFLEIGTASISGVVDGID